MQLFCTVLFLASVADASLAAADAAADAHRPQKKLERPGQQTASGRRALRRASRGLASRSAAPHNDDYWAIRDGLLHLEAAEVETEAVQDIAKVEQEDEREEHPEMAQAEAQEKRQVEGRAVADWSAVARAASAEAVQLRQRASVAADSYAAPAAAPGSAPAAPADFSWAHKMDATKPLQEQGFEGKMIQHVDKDTMTEDWHKEHVQSWSTINEICTACSRHPANSWCRGKCPGALARLGGHADKVVAGATTATADAAADATAASEEGGKSLRDKMLPGGLPEAELPGGEGKNGGQGPPGGLGDIFKSAASGRMLGLPLLLVALHGLR